MARLQSPAVQGSEDEVRHALNGCEVPFVVWGGPDATIWLTNPKFDELIELPPRQVVGRRVPELFSGPANAVTNTVAALESGFVDSSRSRRTLRRGTGALIPVWVWSRGVSVGANAGAVSLVLPMAQLGLAGRDPSAPWRSLATVVVGIADRDWRVEAVSKDVADFSDLCAADIVGHRLPDLLAPITDAGGEHGERADSRVAAGGVEVARRGRLHCPDGATNDVLVLYAPVSPSRAIDGTEQGRDDGRKVFALVGAVDPRVARDPSERVRELELHLQRIGAEVRAARIMDDVADLPMLGVTGPVPDLGDLAPVGDPLAPRSW